MASTTFSGPVTSQNGFIGEIQLNSYTVATAPSAAANPRDLIYVSNGAAGSPVLAFSNGTNWLRVDTLAAISAA